MIMENMAHHVKRNLFAFFYATISHVLCVNSTFQTILPFSSHEKLFSLISTKKHMENSTRTLVYILSELFVAASAVSAALAMNLIFFIYKRTRKDRRRLSSSSDVLARIKITLAGYFGYLYVEFITRNKYNT